MPSPLRLGISLWPQGATWLELQEASMQADALGYHSIWLYDHFIALGPDPSLPVLDGWTALAALASVTKKARLGTLVSGVTHRNPAVLAKMAATLDHVSHGRAVLGLGRAGTRGSTGHTASPSHRRASDSTSWMRRAR